MSTRTPVDPRHITYIRQTYHWAITDGADEEYKHVLADIESRGEPVDRSVSADECWGRARAAHEAGNRRMWYYHTEAWLDRLDGGQQESILAVRAVARAAIDAFDAEAVANFLAGRFGPGDAHHDDIPAKQAAAFAALERFEAENSGA